MSSDCCVNIIFGSGCDNNLQTLRIQYDLAWEDFRLMLKLIYECEEIVLRYLDTDSDLVMLSCQGDLAEAFLYARCHGDTLNITANAVVDNNAPIDASSLDEQTVLVTRRSGSSELTPDQHRASYNMGDQTEVKVVYTPEGMVDESDIAQPYVDSDLLRQLRPPDYDPCDRFTTPDYNSGYEVEPVCPRDINGLSAPEAGTSLGDLSPPKAHVLFDLNALEAHLRVGDSRAHEAYMPVDDGVDGLVARHLNTANTRGKRVAESGSEETSVKQLLHTLPCDKPVGHQRKKHHRRVTQDPDTSDNVSTRRRPSRTANLTSHNMSPDEVIQYGPLMQFLEKLKQDLKCEIVHAVTKKTVKQVLKGLDGAVIQAVQSNTALPSNTCDVSTGADTCHSNTCDVGTGDERLLSNTRDMGTGEDLPHGKTQDMGTGEDLSHSNMRDVGTGYDSFLSNTSETVANTMSSNPARVVHEGYLCDHCDVTIVGVRYKCGNCADYDLCEECEPKVGVHNADHVFIKVKRPCRFAGKVNGVYQALLRCQLYGPTGDPPPGLVTPTNLNWDRFRDKISRMQDKFVKREEMKQKRRLEKPQQKAGWWGKKGQKIDEKYDAIFVNDLSFPDGSVVSAETRFLKSWTIRNSGTMKWEGDTKLRMMWGSLGATSCVVDAPQLAPGEVGIVTVELIAPAEPGKYQSHWKMFHGGVNFGHRVWCAVRVCPRELLEPVRRDTLQIVENEQPVETYTQTCDSTSQFLELIVSVMATCHSSTLKAVLEEWEIDNEVEMVNGLARLVLDNKIRNADEMTCPGLDGVMRHKEGSVCLVVDDKIETDRGCDERECHEDNDWSKLEGQKSEDSNEGGVGLAVETLPGAKNQGRDKSTETLSDLEFCSWIADRFHQEPSTGEKCSTVALDQRNIVSDGGDVDESAVLGNPTRDDILENGGMSANGEVEVMEDVMCKDDHISQTVMSCGSVDLEKVKLKCGSGDGEADWLFAERELDAEGKPSQTATPANTPMAVSPPKTPCVNLSKSPSIEKLDELGADCDAISDQLNQHVENEEMRQLMEQHMASLTCGSYEYDSLSFSSSDDSDTYSSDDSDFFVVKMPDCFDLTKPFKATPNLHTTDFTNLEREIVDDLVSLSTSDSNQSLSSPVIPLVTLTPATAGKPDTEAPSTDADIQGSDACVEPEVVPPTGEVLTNEDMSSTQEVIPDTVGAEEGKTEAQNEACEVVKDVHANANNEARNGAHREGARGEQPSTSPTDFANQLMYTAVSAATRAAAKTFTTTKRFLYNLQVANGGDVSNDAWLPMKRPVPKPDSTPPKGEYRVPQATFKIPQSNFKLPADDFQRPKGNFKIPPGEFKLPSNEFKLPTDEFKLPTDEFKLPTDECKLPTDECKLPTDEFESPDYELKLLIDELKRRAEDCKRIHKKTNVAFEVPVGDVNFPYNVCQPLEEQIVNKGTEDKTRKEADITEIGKPQRGGGDEQEPDWRPPRDDNVEPQGSEKQNPTEKEKIRMLQDWIMEQLSSLRQKRQEEDKDTTKADREYKPWLRNFHPKPPLQPKSQSDLENKLQMILSTLKEASRCHGCDRARVYRSLRQVITDQLLVEQLSTQNQGGDLPRE